MGHDFVVWLGRAGVAASRRGTARAASRIWAGSTPSRYSRAVPRRRRSSLWRLRKAIWSGWLGRTRDNSVKTWARLCPARSRTNSSSGDSLRTPSSSRRLVQTGRPTAVSRRTTSRIRSRSMRDSGVPAREWRPAISRSGTARRTDRRRAPGEAHRPRAGIRRPKGPARPGAGSCSPGLGSSSASVSWPTRSSATLRSAKTA